MDFRCSFCGGNLQNQTNKCLNCGAEYVSDEGLVLSERWVKAKIKLLQDDNKRLQDELTSFKAGAQAELKRLKKLEGTNDHPEHCCQRCGGRNISPWYIDSDIWNRVAGDYGILCPICFIELAAKAGIQPTAWRLSAELSSERILTSRKEILGALANWTIRLSPYLYPSRLPKGLEEFAAEFDPCLTFSAFNSNGDFTMICTVLIRKVREIFNRCPTIMKWSASKPINLDTLAKNIVHSITLEARYNKE